MACSKWKGKSMLSFVMKIALNALVYLLWEERCRRQFQGRTRTSTDLLKIFKEIIRSVKVSNVPLGASDNDIREFFIFSGEIEYVEMHSYEDERSQVAYITYKDPQGAETEVLLSGATIVDQFVTIELASDYKLHANAFTTQATGDSGQAKVVYTKAEDVVSTMLAKGFIIGIDALNKAKSFDEKHQVTSNASAKIASLDQKIGFSKKISAGSTVVNEKMREMDQKYQVSEKSKTALAAAEQSVSPAKSSIMKSRYALAGAAWFTAAYKRDAKAAEDVGQKTREKVLAEEQAQNPEDSAHMDVFSTPRAGPEASVQPSNPSPNQLMLLLDISLEQLRAMKEWLLSILECCCFPKRYVGCSPNDRTGYVVSGKPNGAVGYYFAEHLETNDGDSVTCSVGICSVTIYLIVFSLNLFVQGEIRKEIVSFR
ncbi:binding partner of ACD11 1-like [Hibiscus syriacus]|uniref:binding partner of ACD11 1-like n=1 Tax=Hibiscus syriacus TaxID=106335 RepID=UPI0019241D39|nr:binding partner of ACD11 1-like [Hibiscus syriacus]